MVGCFTNRECPNCASNTLNYEMLFKIKLFSFVQMVLKIFKAMLDITSLRKFSKADAEDKNFRQKLHFVTQGKQLFQILQDEH